MLNQENYKKSRKRLPVIRGTNKPISEEEISNFEKKYNIRIPDQYRDFILTNNGADVSINNVEMELGDEEEGFCIDNFIQLKYAEVGDSEEQLTKDGFDVKPPKGLMTLAYLSGGHAELFIGVDKENYGKIFFCYDREPSELKLIRNSFEELMNNVLPWFENEFEECLHCGDIERVIYLINNGYENPPNLLTEVLERLADYDMTEVLKLLITKEQNISILKNIFFKIPRSPELLDILINKGININEVNERGNTMLMDSITFYNYVIKESDVESRLSLIKFLLEKGTNLKVKNKYNQDVFELIKLHKEDEKFKKYPTRNEVYNKIEEYIKNYN